MMCSSRDLMSTREGQNRAMNNYSVYFRCSYDTCQNTVAFYELSLKSITKQFSQTRKKNPRKIDKNKFEGLFARDYNPLTTVFLYFSHKEFSFSIISIITVFSFFFSFISCLLYYLDPYQENFPLKFEIFRENFTRTSSKLMVIWKCFESIFLLDFSQVDLLES